MAGTRDPEIDEELLAALREIGQRWSQRTDESWVFPGAGRFTDDARLRDPVWIVEQVQKHPELWDLLEAGTTPAHVYEKRHTGKKHTVGRDRVPGHWVLIALAYALSAKVELEVFYQTNSSNERLWTTAGFDGIPSESVFYERMIELEQYIGRIELATSQAWQIAMRNDHRIGRHWKIDGQAYESHVRLEHDPDCPKCLEEGNDDQMPRFIERQALDVADEIRHKENERPADEDDESTAPQPESADASTATAGSVDLEDETIDQVVVAAAAAGPTVGATDDGAPRKKITIQGHRYFCRDEDAGFRIYQSSKGKKLKQWTGGIALKLSEDALGITITTLHIPADEVEHKNLGQLLYQGAMVMQTLPENMMGDRGHATREVKKLNTLLRIGSVIPFRKPNGSYKSRADLAVDGEFTSTASRSASSAAAPARSSTSGSATAKPSSATAARSPATATSARGCRASTARMSGCCSDRSTVTSRSTSS